MEVFKNKPQGIQIPNPCQQSWAEMTPVKQGKFCKSCQKCVTDFTSMSHDEIATFLEQNPQNICGRIGKTQLQNFNSSLQTPPSKWQWRKWKLAAATLVGLTLAVPSMGQNADKKPSKSKQKIEWEGFFHAPQKVEKDNSDSIEEQKDEEKIQLTGKVIDSDSQEIIPFVEVRILDSDIRGFSDFEGIFSLSLEEDSFPIVLRLDCSGYQSIQHTIHEMPSQPLEFALKLEDYAEEYYTEEVILGYLVPAHMVEKRNKQFKGKPAYQGKSFFGRIWHGIKNIFRKKQEV